MLNKTNKAKGKLCLLYARPLYFSPLDFDVLKFRGLTMNGTVLQFNMKIKICTSFGRPVDLASTMPNIFLSA
jgi:hypothetical protein